METTPDGRRVFDFTEAPVLSRFLADGDSDFRCIIGPVGSGKSTGCCVELTKIASTEPPDPATGYRRSRHAIIRNTSPELKTTTLKTWAESFPEAVAAWPVKYTSPISQRIIRKPRGPDQPGLDMELLFVPLDKPRDVAKLKSMDLTSAWINEASETPPAVIQMLRTRIGRFPPRRGNYFARRACIFADTNATDDDHYLARKDRYDRPRSWAFYHQPPAVLEVEVERGKVKCVEPEYRGRVYEEPVIEAAGRKWIVNPEAENLANLRPGYYASQLDGARLDWIRCYLQARYGYVEAGKPVIPEYNDEIMSREIEPVRDLPLMIGMDVGGGTLQPAAVVGQLHPRGVWLILAEIVCQDMGLTRFSSMVKQIVRKTFPGWEVEVAWGDPAGVKRDELYEVVAFDHLRSKGIPAQPAPSNEIKLRVEAITAPMTRAVDGKPGIIVHPRCKTLRKGLSGAWYYKRMQVVGEERYHEKPVKNLYSHPCDALGYLLLGGGEHASLSGRQAGQLQPGRARIEFDVFAG